MEQQTFYNPFILPFCISVIILFTILIIKYTRWIAMLDKEQWRAFRRNIFSWRVFAAAWEAVREGLLHVRIFKHNIVLGFMHASIALGWLLLIVVSKFEATLYCGSIISRPWTGIFFRYFEGINGHRDYPGVEIYTQVMDGILLWVLIGVALAFFKRIYSRMFGMKKTTKHVIFDKIALYAMWLIFPFRLMAESFTAAWANNGGFLTQSIASLVDVNFAQTHDVVFWWLYSCALFVFIVSFPFSRYMHILTEIWLIFYRNLQLKESVKSSGYTKFELSACSRCGICIDGCPINSELENNAVQPVYMLRDIRYQKTNPKAIETCLLCNQCVSDCPVLIEANQIRKQQRNKGDLDTSGNYQYLKDVKAFNSIGRIVYFGGCMSHLTPSIPEAMKKIFEAANQDYWHLDEHKTICCGRPLLQQGFTKQGEDLIASNTKLIQESGAKILVTSCPICYQSFKEEYKDLNIEVMHHTSYIDRLIKKERIQVSASNLSVVYHDPCELGRGAGIYKEPREVIKKVATLLKAKKEKNKTICCGINLGDITLEMSDKMKIRDASLHNLQETGANIICTACPMCKKAFVHGTNANVKDIAELVAENLKQES